MRRVAATHSHKPRAERVEGNEQRHLCGRPPVTRPVCVLCEPQGVSLIEAATGCVQPVGVHWASAKARTRDAVPIRALGPGRHLIWRGPGVGRQQLTEQRFSTDELVFWAPQEIRAALPKAWFEEVAVALRQRGVLYRDGVPQAFLRPGIHRFGG